MKIYEYRNSQMTDGHLMYTLTVSPVFVKNDSLFS